MITITGRQGFLILGLTTCLACATGCQKQEEPPAKPAQPTSNKPVQPTPSAEPGKSTQPPASTPLPIKGEPTPLETGKSPPPRETSHAGQPVIGSARIENGRLALTGITLTVPPGWSSQPISPGPMPPVAVLSMPKADGAVEAGIVRITYFPNMKGRDDMNIDRWCGQVTKPDGKPHTREEANIQTIEQGNVRIKSVDLTGNVKLTMQAEPKANWRMIAAIVDHPQGPHFIVTAGDIKTMEKWAPAVQEFLKSSSVN